MTIEEAIKHAEEVAKKQENNAKNYPRPDKSVKGSGKKYNAYLKCAEEHRQIAEWLKELKRLREQLSSSEKPNKWIPADQPPKTNGRYIVTRHFCNNDFVEMASYATDLHKVDKYDFPKHKAGWYNYDSEYGYYEVDDIVAWMPSPESYKEI